MRSALAVILAAAALAVGPSGAASAQPLDCDSFARIQTYLGWGPSVHYGRTVTVAYAIDRCTGSWTQDTFEYEATGTATIYAGRHPGAGAIEVLPFTTEGRFTDPDAAGWPPAWWSCLATADVLWVIRDVYSFRASAQDGDWTLGINVAGVKPFRWSYSAC